MDAPQALCTLYSSRALFDASDPISLSAVSWKPPLKRNLCREQIASDMYNSDVIKRTATVGVEVNVLVDKH